MNALTAQQATIGEVVIVIDPEADRHNAIGTIAGWADTLGQPKLRVVFGAEVHLYRLDQLSLA